MQELQLKTILVGKLQIQTFEKHWQNIYNKPRVYFIYDENLRKY